MIGFEPGPAGAWGWAAAAAAGAAAWLHARRSPAGRGLLALRAAAAGALALAFLGPVVSVSETKRAKPRLLILLDAGASMRGKAPGGTRWSQAVEWLTRHRAEIEARADATVVAVSDRSRVLGGLYRLAAASPSDAAFAPAEALAGESFGAAPARVWLLSDGGAEGGGDPAAAFARFGAPVDALGAGPSRRERGAAFVDLKTPDFAFLHAGFSVEATVEASDLAGKRATVTLSRADESFPGGWREVARRERAVGADLETFVSSFTATAERLGAEHWRLTAAADGRSRSREFRVEVVRQKYRIMYLAGRPSSEYAFLREFLKSDPNHELVSFVILRNPENPSPAEDKDLSLIAFPSEDIFVRTLPQFDLFILENFSAARFRLPPAYLEQLKRFVASGGALLVKGGENAFAAGGYRGSPLEEVLPVSLSARAAPDFTPGLFAPKPASFEHPLVRLFDTPEESRRAWEALPPLDGWGRFASTRPGAQVVASHPRETADDGSPLPVIAVRSYGRGKVMLISTDSSWRWRLGGAGDRLASGVYERFWTRAVQYLTGSLDLSKVKFAPLPDRVTPREPFVATVRVFEPDFSPAKSAETRVTVLWTPPNGPAREVAARETDPGVYAVELTGLAAGTHRLRASARVRGRPWGEDAESFAWEPAVDAPMDRAWLTKAAAGGGFHDLARTSASELLGSLPPPRPESEVTRRYRPFGTPAWLALAAVLLLAEWSWRRAKGHA